MIKATSEFGSISLKVSGDVSVILADLTGIIEELYKNLPEKDQAFFKKNAAGSCGRRRHLLDEQ